MIFKLAIALSAAAIAPVSAFADVYTYPQPQVVDFNLDPDLAQLHKVMTLEDEKAVQGLYRVEVCNTGREKIYYDFAKSREGATDLVVIDPKTCVQENMHYDQSVYIKRRGSDADNPIRGKVRAMYKVTG